MADVRTFRVEDIGAELFPAITLGLYRDPLDALREYIQNSIDANARKIRITLLKDVVSIQDDGDGMTRAVADKAIRLGISDKNPFQHVGFRGIGIYSSFDLCDRLEIYTKARSHGECTRITVDFAKIRVLLEQEAHKRRNGEVSGLHLQRLLGERVSVEGSDKPPALGASGTLVFLRGVRDVVSLRLSSRYEVEEYLQHVVPLPFHPKFKFEREIREHLTAANYRLVDEIVLAMNGTDHPLYQPYTDEMFEHGGQIPPVFYEIRPSGSKKARWGFAWVCFNDANKVLPQRFRGLLIKKYGFSISNREYLEPLFTKPTIARRITGEVIVESDDLVPNAARTDFEASPARTDFRRALAKLVTDITKRGSELQDHFRALELLDRAQRRVPEIHGEIASAQRDPEALLGLNVELNGIRVGLTDYRTVLQKVRPKEYSRLVASIDEGMSSIKDLLARRRRRTASPDKYMRRAVTGRQTAPTADETPHAADRPESLIELMDGLGFSLDDAVRSALVYIDENLVRPNRTQEDYESELVQLRGYLEDLS